MGDRITIRSVLSYSGKLTTFLTLGGRKEGRILCPPHPFLHGNIIVPCTNITEVRAVSGLAFLLNPILNESVTSVIKNLFVVETWYE